GPDMIETAVEIRPDLAADISPTSAEGEILAEIHAGRRIDHALKQRKAVRAAGQGVMRMLALEFERRVVGVRAHSFEHVPPDHQEAGAGVAHPGEPID